MDVIVAAREVMLEALRTEVLKGPVLSTHRKLLDYLHFALARQRQEQFRVLFLDSQNRLVGDEVLAEGGVSAVMVHPREVLRCAFDFEATALILVHNHPSGNPDPSGEDIALTRKLAAIGAEVGITVHDHLIIARSGWASLRALGVLGGHRR